MIKVDPQPRSAAARFLCVELRGELYALPILSVHEIQAYAAPTSVPRMPHHVRGVANLHGEIVPVIDLRLRLGMPEQAYGPHTVIVYVGVAAQVVGLIVDVASRVLDLDPAQIKPPPAMADLDLSFVAGIARTADRVLVVLDVEALLRGDPALAASAAPPPTAPGSGLAAGKEGSP